VASVLNELGLLYVAAKANAAGEDMFRRALTIRQKAFGINDLQVAEITNNLGALLYTINRIGDALPLMQHAAAITYVALGADNSITKARWNNLQRAMVAMPAASR
jgi:Tfp pilus assembly protein PilF